MSFRETITDNLDALSKSTTVSVELATLALQNGIVSQEEFEILTAPVGSGSTNYDKATFLYTRIARKWTVSEYDGFLSVLEQSGNARAVEILQSSGGSHNDILMKIRSSNGDGSFEGYLLEDELEAMRIVTQLNNLIVSDANAFERPEVLKRIIQLMSNGKIWWNGSKPQLPPDYIDRRVFQTDIREDIQTTLLDLVLPSNNDDPDWNAWDDKALILLVDSPGMGKSCALTKLEQKLRIQLDKSPRVIIRINLNSIGGGSEGSGVESGVQKVLTKLFHPLKNISTGGMDCPVHVLLDGLDEVLPQNQESVLSVIRFLLSKNKIQKGWVIEKILLSTRPHLKDLIENEFKVRAYSLVPLTTQEQVEFIRKRTGRWDAWKLLDDFPRTMLDLMSNPLMLSMFCSVVIPGEQFNYIDEYEIYIKFMVKKHELYVSQKLQMSYLSKRILKQMLDSNVNFYNHVALRETLGEDKLTVVVDLEKRGQIIEPDAGKTTELLSYGVVVKAGEELKFAHRSFAEFFYVRLMTDVDNTPHELRNALFAWGYRADYNVAKFVSCVVRKNADAMQFVSKGWTKYVPEGVQLVSYGLHRSGILGDHILSSTIEHEGNCPRKIELLVRDICERHSFLRWLCQRMDEMLVQHFLLNENNTRIVAALVFYSARISLLGSGDWINGHRLKELCFDVLSMRIASMSAEQGEMFAQDIFRDSFDTPVNPKIYTLLPVVLSRQKLQQLIVHEETRVTDLIGHTGLLSVRFYLGEEFLPKRFLKFRYKFGQKYKGKSLFHGDFSGDLMEKVWEEVEESVQDAVQDVQDNGKLIRHLEKDLMRLKVSPKLRERRKRLLVDLLARVNWKNWTNTHKFGSFNQDKYFNLIAYGKLELADWEIVIRYLKIKVTNQLNVFFGCLMLSALNVERIPGQHQSTLSSSVTVRAPLEMVRKVFRGADIHSEYRRLVFFISELSREELCDCATMRTKDPALLSDLPSVWEMFFQADKGIALVKREKALEVLNNYWVLEKMVEDILQHSLSPAVELRPVLLRERDFSSFVPEECVQRAVIDYNMVKGVMCLSSVLSSFGWRARDLWLSDVQVGKHYVMGVVQVYVDIFQGEVDEIAERLAKEAPVQLLVVVEEKERQLSGGWQQQEWANILKLVQKCIRNVLRYKVSLNGIWKDRWQFARYNRECDWYELLKVGLNESPEIKNKIPPDYANRTKVYSNLACSLLRVWIQLFGEEETRRQADKLGEEDEFRFWESASEEMKQDGELLHIAVEIGSLSGVKWTAWPKMVSWRDGNNHNRTALEYAEDKLGKDHEVTVYLERVVGNLTRSGFLPEVTTSMYELAVKLRNRLEASALDELADEKFGICHEATGYLGRVVDSLALGCCCCCGFSPNY